MTEQTDPSHCFPPAWPGETADQIRNEFEAVWGNGEAPVIEEFLARPNALGRCTP